MRGPPFSLSHRCARCYVGPWLSQTGRNVKRLKVGITVVGGDGRTPPCGPAGSIRNIVYLALLFQRLPEVELCALVAWPPGGTGPSAGRALRPADPAARRSRRAARRHHRARRPGGDRVHRPLSRARRQAGLLHGRQHHDDELRRISPTTWPTATTSTLSASTRSGSRRSTGDMNHAYCAITRTPNVEIAPHIWHPLCLEPVGLPAEGQSVLAAAGRQELADRGVRSQRQRGQDLPSAAAGLRGGATANGPDLISRVLMFSASHLKGNPHFEQFCSATDLGRAGKRVRGVPAIWWPQMLGRTSTPWSPTNGRTPSTTSTGTCSIWAGR